MKTRNSNCNDNVLQQSEELEWAYSLYQALLSISSDSLRFAVIETRRNARW